MIKPKDAEILNILVDNARLSARELEKAGIIKGYSAEIDSEKIGYDVHAIIRLQIAKGKLFEVENKIAVHPNVFAVYDVTGEFDALVIAKFKSMKLLDSFLKKIQT